MEHNEQDEFFETLFRLDACDDTHEFLDFVQGKRHATKDLLTAASQLLSKGRVRSAYILAMLLAKRGQRHLTMSVALSVGGLIYGNSIEEENGLQHLQAQFDALSVEEQQKTYDHIVAPIVAHLWLCSIGKADNERVMRILQHFRAAVPDGFDWRAKVCKLCGGSAEYWFHAQVLGRYRVAYHLCEQCDFLFTEEPYWLAESYEGVIKRQEVDDKDDADGVARTMRLKEFVSMLLRNLFDAQGKFLDYGGSYGLFVRLMRDEGFEFYWQDNYCPNLFARGFEAVAAVEGEAESRYELVTAFECFQHFVDPVQELDHIFAQSDAVLFTTRLLPNPVPKADEWSYYALESGRHVSFYSAKSLRTLAKNKDLTFLSNGTDTHLLAKRHISSGVFKGISRWGG
ncbi:MAG: class I SAM-dependent methyltransferase [Magnetococcales bacterium]|nr:class I SAM-dependent methyltransferase [Magnetococcales bacterium]